MRPTTSTMLQQNNNNNYPCLNMSASTQEMLQKCSRAALPFPSRLELGDLPLIRGLRAWALCSRNRRKAGGLLAGRQAPTAPHTGRGNSTSCSKPAGVYLSGDWGRTRYGLPLGVDARQAEIGPLVTVATLKTSEGSGKTQTQCLFLQTEKGSCLYSTAKPGSGGTADAGSSVVGGWLRGKTGGRGRDIGPNAPAQTGANRVRVGSGRRWRKSGNASGREKTVVSRERQQRSREDPRGEITLEERKEVQDKGAPDSEEFHSPQQDNKKARQDKEGGGRTPRCCHNASPKTCTQCRRRAQRRGSQDRPEEGESPSGERKGLRKEEEEGGGICKLRSSNSVLAAPNPDLKSNPECPRGSDVEETREAKGNEELKGGNTGSEDDFTETEPDGNSEDSEKKRTENQDFIQATSEKLTDYFKLRHDQGSSDGKPAGNPSEEVVDGVKGICDHLGANREFETEMENADVEEDESSSAQSFTEAKAVSDCYHDAVSICPTALFSESSVPLEGVCSTQHAACGLEQDEENSQGEHLERHKTWEEDGSHVGKTQLDPSGFEPRVQNNTVKIDKNGNPQVFIENEKNKTSSSPLRHRDLSLSETDEGGDRQTSETERRREPASEGDNGGTRANPETWNKTGENQGEDQHTGVTDREPNIRHEVNISAQQEDNSGVKRNCAPTDRWRLQECGQGCGEETEDGGACSQTSVHHIKSAGKTGADVTNVACAQPFTSPALCLANPAPPPPPLGSMATGLPCVVVAKEEEEEEVEEGEGNNKRVTTRGKEGVQEGTRRNGGALEVPGEGERGCTVATEDGRKGEEEQGEEDEFGVFMQAEGEPSWSEGFAMSASGPRGGRESVALGRNAITGESTRWTPGWTDSSLPQSDENWTAFPLDSWDGSGDAVGQWWPSGVVERDGPPAGPSVVSVFAEAFPSLPGLSFADPSDLSSVPTLTQLLRGRASQNQGLLDSFHDLNKMIGQRYKRANGLSRDLLLNTLHLEQPQTESRPSPWSANRRPSPGLPSANQHARNAAAKRRLSYDYNRNLME